MEITKEMINDAVDIIDKIKTYAEKYGVELVTTYNSEYSRYITIFEYNDQNKDEYKAHKIHPNGKVYSDKDWN